MPLTFQHSYDQHQSLTKFQFTLEIKSVSYEYTSTVANKLFNFAPAACCEHKTHKELQDQLEIKTV